MKYFISACCSFAFLFSQSQTYILQENFEGSFPPAGWSVYTNPNNSADGWMQGPTYPLIDPCVPEGVKTMTSQWATYYANDTWAFTPAQNLTAGVPYTLTFSQCVKSPSNNKTESLKVTVGNGNSVQNQTTVLLDFPALTNTSSVLRSAVFTPSVSGVYHFGFHCYSLANQRYLSVDNVKLSYQNGCTHTTLLTDTMCSAEPYNFNGTLLTAGGVYYDTLQNMQGCDSTLVLSLISKPSPISTVSQNGGMLTSNETSATYQWIECSGSIIAGATSQHYTPVVNGLYAVILNKNGCMDTSACYTVNNLSQHEEAAHPVQVYPNPASGWISISGAEQISYVRILDITGRVYYTENEKASALLNLQMLPPGMYMLEIGYADEVIFRRFIKE